jgi:hypothetical protein
LISGTRLPKPLPDRPSKISSTPSLSFFRGPEMLSKIGNL